MLRRFRGESPMSGIPYGMHLTRLTQAKRCLRPSEAVSRNSDAPEGNSHRKRPAPRSKSRNGTFCGIHDWKLRKRPLTSGSGVLGLIDCCDKDEIERMSTWGGVLANRASTSTRGGGVVSKTTSFSLVVGSSTVLPFSRGLAFTGLRSWSVLEFEI